MLDIVIPTSNRGERIRYTLKSLQASRYAEIKVWVVDQSDDERTADVVRAFARDDARFVLIREKRKGSNHARNVGLRAGNSPIVAFTDDDCLVTPTWAENLLKAYQEDEKAWSVFGQVCPGHDAPPALSFDQPKVSERLEKVLPMAKMTHPERLVFERNPYNLGFGHGANMSFRRDIFAQLGFFDELLGAGGVLRSWPERDIGYRILRLGGRIVYTPDALIYHHHWRVWPGVRKTYRNYAIGTGAAIGKYIRLGDWGALSMLLDWFWGQGIRQIVSGIIKWQSLPKIQVGIIQLIYPFVGLWQGSRYPLDREHWIYQDVGAENAEN